MRVVGAVPTEDRERKDAGRDPHVEHVGLLAKLAAGTVGAGCWRSAGDDDLMAGVTVPGWDAMAPPELARDAPVVEVVHPFEVGLRVVLRSEADMAVADGGHRLVGKRGAAV